MKKTLLLTIGLITVGTAVSTAETVETEGKTYEITTLIDRDLGPGVRYTRLRLPDYPLNVNLLRIDVTNPYNSIETTQAADKLYSTESLVKAAQRQTTPGHVALAGANANFWCVSGQPPYSDVITGYTYGGSVQNGKVITELNMASDQWNGGNKHTGILGITTGKKVYSMNNYTWQANITNEKTGTLDITTANRTVRDGEIGMYNSFYPSNRNFKCVDQYEGTDGKQHFNVVDGIATEVYLTLDPGQEWLMATEMTFTVMEVKQNAGSGKIGSYDMVVVGRGDKAEALNKLAIGDKVTFETTFINTKGNKVKIHNLVAGNAQVMKAGEMTKYATSESYNSQVYSRTGYGASEDHKTLYIIVIDKATDPVYGSSKGCSSTVMCDIARHYGCYNMTNMDAGGSAEMLVGDAIINKTTESSPRAVANGMIAYNIAPEDNNVARLEFYDYELKSPVYASSTPRIIAYNQYGTVLNDDFKDATLSCPEEAGTCDGATFTAGGTGVTSTLTATYNGISVTKPVTVVESQIALRLKNILIDYHREYPLEVTANVEGKDYAYNPASIKWAVADNTVADVDINGTLRGIKEGTTEVSGQIGSFTDGTIVTVEEAPTPRMAVTGGAIVPEEWKLSYTGAKNGVITPIGENSGFGLDYTISSTRSTKVTVARDAKLYSLPDAVELNINPGTAKIKSIILRLQPANAARFVDVSVAPKLTPSVENTVKIDMSEFGDNNDIAFYPVTFKAIAVSLDDATGKYHIDIPSMYAVYNNFTESVSDIATDNAVGGTTRYYTIDGIEIAADALTPGLYIKVNGTNTEKVIIK